MVGTEAAAQTPTRATSEPSPPHEGEPEIIGALSPSRASDFLTCPLRYRFRVIDQIPERPTPEAARGTVVHAVLERLFDLPADRRTLAEAASMLQPRWQELLEAEPELAELFGDADGDAEGDVGTAAAEFFDAARGLLDSYFTLEDPTRLEPAEREAYVECRLESGLLLRGYVDRLDVAPDGAMRVVDYKTGKAPHEAYEQRALFQMRFYALVLWRTRGVVPKLLQLVYLGSGHILRYAPDEADLLATERKLAAIWAAIDRARTTGEWRASPGPLCDWCDHKVRCPAWGGTPPPLPDASPPASSSSVDGELGDAPSAHAPVIDL